MMLTNHCQGQAYKKGTSNGVVTDFDCNFILTVTDNNATLVLSYIGFEAREIALDDSSNYNIQLMTTSTGLDEVVVIGYGSVKKSDLTGALGNFGSIRNKGVKFTRNRNEILKLEGDLDIQLFENYSALIVGKPSDAIYDLEVEGICQIDEAAQLKNISKKKIYIL